jgi:hypothetical protein
MAIVPAILGALEISAKAELVAGDIKHHGVSKMTNSLLGRNGNAGVNGSLDENWSI